MPADSDYSYELFISYAEADRDWVRGYLLPSLGLSAKRVVTPEDFRPGKSLVSEFERVIVGSRYVVLVISPAYLADTWSTYSEQLTSYAGVAAQRDRLIPLLLRPAVLPLRIDFRVKLNYVGEADWENETARLRDLLAQPEPPPEHIPCPYPGMTAFGEADRGRFFGREKEVEELIRLLRLHPFLTVIGPSGSGKSSLVFAGLLPALRKSGLFGAGEWMAISLRPGEDPPLALSDALKQTSAAANSDALDFVSPPAGKRLLLVIDQFEELFTITRTGSVAFQHALRQLASAANCYVVLTARADFYADLMTSALWAEIQSHRFELLPLGEDGLRRAVSRPAEDAGVFIEAELVSRLVRDATNEPGVLPLIQETLVLLWEKLQRRFLPFRAYQELGDGRRTGLQVAIAQRADAVFARLSPDQQTIARRIFIRLVQFGEGRPDTRRQQSASSLRNAEDDLNAFEDTLDHLAANRLLTLSGSGLEGRKVDLAHEAIITGWAALQEWLSLRRDAEQTRRRLEGKAAEWIRLGRGAGGLLDGVELAEAEGWLRSFDGEDLGYSENLLMLVQSSRRGIDQAEQEREAARRREVAQLQALAEEQRQRAEAERQRAAEAERLRLNAIALALATQVQQGAFTPEQHLLLARQAHIFNRRGRGHVAAQIDAALRAAFDSAPLAALLRGHTKSITAMVFSPDGQTLATSSADGTVRLWFVQQVDAFGAVMRGGSTGAEVLSVDPAGAGALAFSPDGKTLAVTGLSGTLSLWRMSAQDGAPVLLAKLEDVASAGYPITFSPYGGTLAFVGRDGTLQIWDVRHLSKPVRVLGRDCPQSLRFSPDAQTLISSSGVFVRFWELAYPEGAARSLSGRDFNIRWASAHREATFPFPSLISPDGRTLAICAGELHHFTSSAVKLWDLHEPGAELKSIIVGGLVEGFHPVMMAFSADGKKLATANREGGIVLCDLERLSARPVVTRDTNVPSYRHIGPVTALALSPDGQVLAWGTENGIVGLRFVDCTDATRKTLATEIGVVHAVASSPDGSAVAGSNLSQDVYLIALTERDKPRLILDAKAAGISPTLHRGIDPQPYCQRPSPSEWLDGYMPLLSRESRLAFAPTGEPIMVRVMEGPARMSYLALDVRDGRRTAVVKNFELPDLSSLKQVTYFDRGSILTAGVNPHGQQLVVAGTSYLLVIFDSENSNEPFKVLQGQHQYFDRITFSSAVFSPDCRFLVAQYTYYNSGGLELWDLQQPDPTCRRLNAPGGWASAIAFSPDGKRLAVGYEYGEEPRGRSSQGSIALWNLESAELDPAILLGHKSFVSALAFSPDGAMLASADGEAIKFWDLSHPADSITVQTGVGRILSLSFSPAGRVLVSGGYDGTVRGWVTYSGADSLADLVCERVSRNLTGDEWRQFIGNDIPYECTCPNLPSSEAQFPDGIIFK